MRSKGNFLEAEIRCTLLADNSLNLNGVDIIPTEKIVSNNDLIYLGTDVSQVNLQQAEDMPDYIRGLNSLLKHAEEAGADYVLLNNVEIGLPHNDGTAKFYPIMTLYVKKR